MSQNNKNQLLIIMALDIIFVCGRNDKWINLYTTLISLSFSCDLIKSNLIIYVYISLGLMHKIVTSS